MKKHAFFQRNDNSKIEKNENILIQTTFPVFFDQLLLSNRGSYQGEIIAKCRKYISNL